MPDLFFLQIPASSEEVQDLSAQDVLHHGIDGKITPPGCLFLPQKRIDKHRKILVPAAGCLFRPRHRDIQSVMPQPHHAEACSHGQALAETVQDAFQNRYRNAVNLQIDVLAFPAEQLIPDTTSYEVGPAAGTVHFCRDPPRHTLIRIHCRASFLFASAFFQVLYAKIPAVVCPAL